MRTFIMIALVLVGAGTVSAQQPAAYNFSSPVQAYPAGYAPQPTAPAMQPGMMPTTVAPQPAYFNNAAGCDAGGCDANGNVWSGGRRFGLGNGLGNGGCDAGNCGGAGCDNGNCGGGAGCDGGNCGSGIGGGRGLFGGLLGMGDKLFAVPWAAMTLDTVEKRFTLDVPKPTLKDAPGFDKDHWPSMSDRTWAGGVHKFYGTPCLND